MAVIIIRYQDDGQGEFLTFGPEDRDLLGQLRMFCLTDLPNSARITALTPSRVEVVSSEFGGQRRFRAVYEGPAEEMAALFRAASVAYEKTKNRPPLPSFRDAALDYARQDGLAACLGEAGKMKVGHEIGIEALIAGIGFTDEDEITLARSIGVHCTLASLYLQRDGMLLSEAGELTKRLRDALRKQNSFDLYFASEREVLRATLDSRDKPESMRRHLEAFEAAVAHKLSYHYVEAIFAKAADGASFTEAAEAIAQEEATKRAAALAKMRGGFRWPQFRLPRWLRQAA